MSRYSDKVTLKYVDRAGVEHFIGPMEPRAYPDTRAKLEQQGCRDFFPWDAYTHAEVRRDEERTKQARGLGFHCYECYLTDLCARHHQPRRR